MASRAKIGLRGLARCVGTIWVVITLGVATPLAAQPVSESAPAEPIAQAYDDDCGLAALQTLFHLAGMELSAESLADGLSRTTDGAGLSGSDLIDMVAHVDQGVELAAGFVPFDGLERLASREAVIILMQPRSFGGASGFDHFVVLNRRMVGGYRVADPVLAAQSFISDAIVQRDAHMTMIDGRPHILVFRLMRDGAGAAPAARETAEDSRLRSWDLLHRLPRPLPRGKWTVAATVAYSFAQVPFSDDLLLEDAAVVSRLVVARGLTARSQISLEAVVSEADTSLRTSGEAFSLGSDTRSSARLTWTTYPDYALPFGMTGSYGLEAYWTSFGLPTEIAATVAADHRMGDFGFGLGAEARVDVASGETVFYVSPTASYERVLANGVTVGVALTTPSMDFDMPDRAYASAFVSRSLSSDANIVLFYERELIQELGIEESQVGITITYGIPRRFPRSRSPG